MLKRVEWMGSVERAGTRLGNSSLWAGQTDGWSWQRLSKPFCYCCATDEQNYPRT